MPHCARCEREYDEAYDGCPECAKERIGLLYSIKSSVRTVSVIMVLLVIVTLLGSCASTLGLT